MPYNKHQEICPCLVCISARVPLGGSPTVSNARAMVLRGIMRELDVDSPNDMPEWILGAMLQVAGTWVARHGGSVEAAGQRLHQAFADARKQLSDGQMPVDVVSPREYADLIKMRKP